ncbi:hypothetical protein ZWY2020_014150 [Hordeum vulgare]|nr:hypothetical protein ZWY2020_014150 [Hordeum vulgare]
MAGSSVSGGGGGGRPSLFATEKPKRVLAYRLYAGTIFAGILLIWFYRATHIPARGSSSLGWRAGLGLLVAELWFGLYWVLTLSVRWNPVRRTTFKDRLSASYDDDQLPAVDIFVCTADPDLERPMLVISTVLSVMAYDYPPEKLNIYLSDDAGSAITFYALHEASEFAKHWIPFCKNYKVEPRSPAAYFAQGDTPHDACSPQELLRMKELYKDLTDHVNSVVHSGKIPEVPECNRRGFSEWNETITPGDHPSIVQILIDRNKRKAVDVDGNTLPKLVYMAREKRPQEQHHFKAGSLNALIRISSVISNSPVILNVDCDMYSNNSESVRDALCFFLDEEQGQDIGFVQYPQNFDNVVHNDIYGNPINVVNELDNPCLDGWGGMCYYGTGCFHRREALSGQIYSKDYKEDWAKGVGIAENADELEETSKSLVTCTYEHNTPWGIEELDMVPTGGCYYRIANPMPRVEIDILQPVQKGLLRQGAYLTRPDPGSAQEMVRRVPPNIPLNYSPFLLGHGKIKLGLQMGYSVCGFWALNSFPTFYYVIIPSLCFLSGVSVFPEITSPWCIPFIYVVVAAYSWT